MAFERVEESLPSDNSDNYNVYFFNKRICTTVTHDPDIVSNWISNVEFRHRPRLHHLIIGLDVEWRPSFNSHIRYPAATLQLCVGHRCLVFQLIHSPSIPPSLVDFLANPNSTFVGVGIKADVEKLEEDYQFGFNTNVVDLRDLAAARYRRSELNSAGLKRLVRLVLRKEVEKPESVTRSGWDNRRLTPDQVRHACIDAFVCFQIGRILNASSA